MKKKIRRLAAGLLALTLLAGCSGGGGETQKPAMGRYVETELTLPEGVTEVLGYRADDQGLVELLSYIPSAGEKADQWLDLALFSSADGGATWTQSTIPALGMEDENGVSSYSVSAAAWDGRGALYFYATDYSGEDTREVLFRLDTDGTLRELPNSPTEAEAGVRSLRVADNGDLLLDRWWNLTLLDGQTGEVRAVYEPIDGQVQGFDFHGDGFAMADGDKVVFYDRATGGETGRVDIGAYSNQRNDADFLRLMDFSSDGSLCVADSSGVSLVRRGNSMVERAVDGNLTSLSVPSMGLQGLMKTGDRFLVLYHDGEKYRLMAYDFDPDMPTLPETELRVWSMEEDPIIRQTIGVFQKAHPEVQVSYEYILPGQESVTWSDALKSLATELVAEKGPDILVLDGLPLASYIEKGVLLDLSEDLGALTGAGTVLPNKAGALLREDGTCYAIPAQFRTVLLHGSPEAVATSGDLESMADWLESHRDGFNHPLYLNQLDWLLQLLSLPDREHISAGDPRALTEFLTQLKRIWDLELASPVDDGMSGSPDFQFGALIWMVDACGLDIGELIRFENLYAAHQADQEKEGGGAIDTLYGEDYFMPSTILGVNSRSRRPDLARDFIRTALSQEVQEAGVGVGMPVNTAAFDASTRADEDPRRNGAFSFYGTTLTDKDGAYVPIYLDIYYPSQAFRDQWAEKLKALDTPVLLDGNVASIIEEGTAAYFAGKSTLEETVAELSEKLSFYQLE